MRFKQELLVMGVLYGLPEVILTFSPLADCSIHNRRLVAASRARALHSKTTPREDYGDKANGLNVSDDETLLACRAYLQRKNKLGRPEHERRKRRAGQAFAHRSSVFAAAGFFWEDPSELKYMKNRPPHLQDLFIDDTDDEEEEESDGSTSHQRVVFDESHSVTDDERRAAVLERGGQFTSFPAVPPQERLRRSQAAKKTWSDPEWKAKWYEKRWGGDKCKQGAREEKARQRKIGDRVRSLPSDLLTSPELASLSEEEIEDAIRTYVESNRKRSESHRRNRSKAGDRPAKSTSIDSDARPLIEAFGSEEALKEVQRKRSERSSRAYKTRLKNQQDSSTKPRRRKQQAERTPTSDTPRDAAARIQSDLERNKLPSMGDVEIILKPRKLGGRKELLRRILNEHFDLRGKCIPSEDGEKLHFVTQCPIDELGGFTLAKMREKMASTFEV